jgi:hypothetical protein
MSKRVKTNNNNNNKVKSCLLLDKIPNLLILHQLAPFIEFNKLSLLSRANKQLHRLLGFLFKKSLWWQAGFNNPIKVYFSRITCLRAVKYMYWDVIDQIEYFTNIKTLDLTQYWTGKDIMLFPKFTGTLVTSMDYSISQVLRQLKTFPNISELVAVGRNTPKKDGIRFKNKKIFTTELFQQIKLPETIKSLKIVGNEQHEGLCNPVRIPVNWLMIQQKLESMEFDYPISSLTHERFYYITETDYPAVTKIIDSNHIFKKEGNTWYYATHQNPTEFKQLIRRWYDWS